MYKLCIGDTIGEHLYFSIVVTVTAIGINIMLYFNITSFLLFKIYSFYAVKIN